MKLFSILILFSISIMTPAVVAAFSNSPPIYEQEIPQQEQEKFVEYAFLNNLQEKPGARIATKRQFKPKFRDGPTMKKYSIINNIVYRSRDKIGIGDS